MIDIEYGSTAIIAKSCKAIGLRIDIKSLEGFKPKSVNSNMKFAFEIESAENSNVYNGKHDEAIGVRIDISYHRIYNVRLE